MPPSRQTEPDRPATLLETDDDIRQALQPDSVSKADVTVAPPTAAAPPAAPPPVALPYRPTQRPLMALLTVLDDGESTGEVLRLRNDRFVIGRSEGDLRIPHDTLIAARHLEIVRKQAAEGWRWML